MENKKLLNRLSRLQGQLRKLQSSIEQHEDCTIVIPQFLAVKGAMAAAYEEYIKQSFEHCPINDKQKMAALIKLLARS